MRLFVEDRRLRATPESEKTLVKACMLTAVPVGILRSSPIPRIRMSFACR